MSSSICRSSSTRPAGLSSPGTVTSEPATDRLAGSALVETTTRTTASARLLRLQLDDLMETTFVNTPDSIEEVKLEQFLMLVSQYSDEDIKLCIEMTKPLADENSDQQQQHASSTSPSSSWYTGRLPLHLACDKSAPLEVISWLLDHDETKHTIRIADKWGDLPLHTVCSRHGIQKNIVEIVQLLLEADDQIVASQRRQERSIINQKQMSDEMNCSDAESENAELSDDISLEGLVENISCPTVFTEDNDGFLPLHMACRYLAPPSVVKLLLDHDRTPTKESLRHAGGPYPQLPLAVACRCNSPVAVVQLLLEYDTTKQTVITPDEVTGRIPLHIALLRPSPIQKDVVRLLLQHMIQGRMEEVGIRRWKYIVQAKIIDEALCVYERDWNVREKLDIIKEALTIFVEQTHVMELVLWKIQCWMQVLWLLEQIEENENGDNVVSITAPLDDLVTKYGITDLTAYKQRARVSSGWTDNVVPVIMSFLEADVIDNILCELF